MITRKAMTVSPAVQGTTLEAAIRAVEAAIRAVEVAIRAVEVAIRAVDVAKASYRRRACPPTVLASRPTR